MKDIWIGSSYKKLFSFLSGQVQCSQSTIWNCHIYCTFSKAFANMFSKWGYLSKNLLSAKRSENSSCCLYLEGDYLLLRQNESALTHFSVQGDISKPGVLWKNQGGVIGYLNGTWSPICIIVNGLTLVKKLYTVAKSGLWVAWGKISKDVSFLGCSFEFKEDQQSSFRATTKNR